MSVFAPADLTILQEGPLEAAEAMVTTVEKAVAQFVNRKKKGPEEPPAPVAPVGDPVKLLKETLIRERYTG